MKKVFTLIAAALMAASVSATETPVTSWTFDDASSPVLDNSTGTGTTADYSHAAVVGNVGSGNNFLNAYRAANGNGELKATITAENLTSAAKWVLEFDFAGFSGCNNNAGQTIIADAEGNAILTITDAAGWGSTFALSDGNTIACYACEKTNRGSANTGNQLSAIYWHHFTIIGGASGIKMTVARYKADGTLGDEVISKSQLSSTNATPSSISIKAGSWGSMGIDNLSLITSDEADVVYNYTVKYINMYEEVEIKDAAVRSDEEGASITLTAADKADFYTADGLSKYIYYSDDSKNKQVSPDGSTVVTVSFMPADIYDFTVNAVYGSKTKEITSGTSFDGDAVTVGYPKYIFDDENAILYTSGDYPFQTTFTPDQPRYKKTITYSVAEEETNVVYFAEAEDIEGVSPFADGNTGIRMSNGAVGEADSIAVATLPAGKYTLTSSSRSGETQFLVEGETILTITSSGSVTDGTSPEFTIMKDGTNVMAKNVLTSGHKNYFDYVLIRKTGNVNYTEIKAVKDTVVIKKGSGFGLSDIVTINSSADMSQFSGMNMFNAKLGIAAAGEGTDKATATYTESGLLGSMSMISTVGDYYVYAKVPVTYQDQSTEDVISDTLVVQVKDVYYLNVEENLPDTIKYLKGTDEDMKPMLSNYMTAVSDGVLSADMFIANAIEGVTKENATYAGYGTEEDAKNAMSTPGAYFAYGVVTASYDDKDPLTYTTDTIVIVVSDPNQFEIETMLEYQEIADNATADEVKDFFAVYTANTTDLKLYIGVAKAENDEADKADLSYDEYNAEEFDQNFEPGTYYIYMRGFAAFENGEEATAKSDTVCLVVSAVQTEPIVSTHTWDFTHFSETTVANLIADAAESKLDGWSDVEKQADAEADVDPTELSKDNCFWFTDNANVDGYLTANGQVIEELEGLVFQNETYNKKRSIAIAVNYASTALGDYAGGSYLWLGGKNFDAFTIKNVKAGTTITMGVESHKLKPADPRGVKLMLDGTELKDPEGNAVAAPTTYTEQTWQVPYPASALSAKGGALSADADGEVVDIIVRNTNGCHIYFIDADIEENATAIEAVSEDASYAGAKKFVKNGQLIIATGNKQFNAAGGQLK